MSIYPNKSAAAAGILRCPVCATLISGDTNLIYTCPLCHKRVHVRKPQSIETTIAYLVASILLYLPANLLPIMRTTELAYATNSTIVEGVMALWAYGSYPTAAIIFVASVFVPVMKILLLVWLVVSVLYRSRRRPKQRTHAHQLTEFIGRWSMVDVFVVALLVALVQFTGVLTVQPGPAALAFCGVVVFTMLAAFSFDTRLIWDVTPND